MNIAQIFPNAKLIVLDPDIAEKVKASHELQIISYVPPEKLSLIFGSAPQGVHSGQLRDYRSPRYYQGKIEEMLIDSRTENNESRYRLQKIFYVLNPNSEDIELRLYRQKIYGKVKIINDLENPFSLIPGTNDFVHVNVTMIEHDTYKLIDTIPSEQMKTNFFHYGKISIILDKKRQALPSLAPDEKLRCMHVSGVDSKCILVDYCSVTNQYHIRLTGLYPQNKVAVNIDFILSYPKIRPMISDQYEKILQEVNNFELFGDKKLTFEIGDEPKTGKELVLAMYKQRQGACRHRSPIFWKWLKEKFPNVPSRIISNHCHMFVEICLDKNWIRCDLGGHRIQSLVIEEPHHPSRSLEIYDLKKSQLESLTQDSLNPHFITWEHSQEEFTSFKAYCEFLFKQQGKNILVQIPTDDSVNLLAYLFQYHAIANGISIYYIDSPDAIKCKAPYAYIDEEGRVLVEKVNPGGPLYDFLTNEKRQVLLVNWCQFSPSDIVSLNTLIDGKQRRGDGVRIPNDCIVMGLYYNFNDPRAYTGSDFRRRHQLVSPCPFSSNQLARRCARVSSFEHPIKTDREFITVNLYQSSEWESLLIGKIEYDENGQLAFSPGPLLKILHDRNLTLKNAPQEAVDFLDTAQQRGYIYFYGKRIELPPDFRIVYGKGYEWDTLITPELWTIIEFPKTITHLPFKDSALPRIYMLNPQTLYHFFTLYQVRDGHLFQLPGILAKNSSVTTTLYLNNPLTIAQWGKLLEYIQHNEFKVRFCVPQSLVDSLPESLSEIIKKRYKVIEDDLEIQLVKEGEGQVIIAEDIDYTLNLLVSTLKINGNKAPFVIDISDCTTGEIIGSISTSSDKKDKKETQLMFKKTLSFIQVKLVEGEIVILKGNFSRQLADCLAPLCQRKGYWLDDEGNKCSFKGQLYIVSDKFELFKALPVRLEETSYSQKVNLLQRLFPGAFHPSLIEDLSEDLSFIAYYDHVRRALINVPLIEIPPELYVLNLDDTDDICQQFNNCRLQQIKTSFMYSPLVVISGPTGVGKSGFIDYVLKKQQHAHVFDSEKSLEEWAVLRPGDDKDIVLFIDEANIAGKNWSVFEGLFNNPPSIYYKEKYYDLTKEHKVIFAGNPYEYAGGRNQPDLFKHHPTAIVKFSFLPPAYIYGQILKPLLVACGVSKTYLKQISIHLLTVYDHVCKYSDKHVLMTPRSLQMIVLQIVRALKLKKGSNTEVILNNLLLATELSLPKHFQQPFREWFLTKYKDRISDVNKDCLPCGDINQAAIDLEGEGFYFTTGRDMPYRQLSTMLEVRQLKCDSNNLEMQHCGWGGILFEGEPGSGKTEFVQAVLGSQGFEKVESFGEVVDKNRKIYYHLDPSLSLSDKKKVLKQAFRHGAVVVIDEINSCLLPERLLNSMLMGRDSKNQPAECPGFMLIGTQNSVGLMGRKMLSPALQQRLMKVDFEPYSHSEIVFLLEKVHGMEEPTANKVARDYLIAREYAITHHKDPIPTFDTILSYQEKEKLNLST